MNILHIITRLIFGGAQQNTVQSCAAQVAAGHRVHLAYGPIYGPEGSLLGDAQQTGATLHEVSAMVRAVRPVKDWRCCRALRRLIRQVKPDVVHTHSSKAGIVGRAAAWAEQVPAVVHTVHGLPFNDKQSALVRGLFIRAERWAARRCHKLIGITQAMCDAFVEHDIAPAEQFTVVPSGVDVAFWEDASGVSSGRGDAIRQQTRNELGIPADAPVVGLVARYDPLKGHADLIRIAPQIVERFTDLRLLFVGDGWHRADVEREVRDAGLTDRVIMTGMVPQPRVAALYRAMDVHVLPSYQEGQSRILVEALLCGCPIVAYDVGGIGEVCIDHQTGRLVPCGDTDALRDAIVWSLDHRDESQRLTERGRRHAAEHFSVTQMCRKLEQVYTSVLERNRKAENGRKKAQNAQE